ncbi:MAG: hypothetical protein AAFU80_14660 [Pseudomonadota bacterium]
MIRPRLTPMLALAMGVALAALPALAQFGVPRVPSQFPPEGAFTTSQPAPPTPVTRQVTVPVSK